MSNLFIRFFLSIEKKWITPQLSLLWSSCIACALKRKIRKHYNLWSLNPLSKKEKWSLNLIMLLKLMDQTLSWRFHKFPALKALSYVVFVIKFHAIRNIDGSSLRRYQSWPTFVSHRIWWMHHLFGGLGKNKTYKNP